MLSTEELLNNEDVCPGVEQGLGSGLCGKRQYLQYLKSKKMPLPIWYFVINNQKMIGQAVFRGFKFFMPVQIGKKSLFNIRLKGIKLETPFLKLDKQVFDCLSPKEILNRRGANILVFYCIPTKYLDDFKKIKLMPGVIRFLGRPRYQHSFIRLNGTFEHYCSKFKSKGYKLRRKEKRFAKNCKSQMILKEYNSLHDVDEFLAGASHISRKTYQHRLLKVGFTLSDNLANYVRFLAENGFLKSFILFDGTTPVAYLYGSLVDGKFTAHKTGYDPQYACLSPGNVLWFRVIENLFSDPSSDFFDLSEGESRFKNYFGSESIECTNIYYLRKTLINFSLILAYITYDKIHKAIIKIVIASDLNQKTKKLFETTNY